MQCPWKPVILPLILALCLAAPALGKAGPGKWQPVDDFYVVLFEEAPLAAYDGDVAGLAATSPSALDVPRLDPDSSASAAYLQFLAERQAAHLEHIRTALKREVEVVFRYRAAGNGIAAKMSRQEARRVEELPGVKAVIQDYVVPLDTDRGPTWIGAPAIWDGTATGGLPGTMGEGVVVGVIDSGANMDHPSFAATGGDGYTHVNPNGAGVFVGWCDPSHPDHDPSYVCNDKLIGGWDYTDVFCAVNPECSETDGPEDDNGHGSHTASTAAGNVLLSPAISGVAPHANLITYDSCYTNDLSGEGLCPFSATSAGVDQAVLDGVDATNYSIGGGNDPWAASDIDSFFLNAVAAGIYAAASAGNSGPDADTTGHDGPWMSTTGSSTHDRVTVETMLIDLAGGMSPPGDLTGASRTAGYGPETVVYARNFPNGDPDPEQCLSPFPAGTWTAGEIVLCDRGSIARVLKCAHVAAGGAAGCILANADAGQTDPVADAHVIPAIHVGLADGDALRAWLATGAGHSAEITDSMIIIDPAVADIMSDFSSRGPAGPAPIDVVKPDLTAPGDAVFAAVASDDELPPPEFATFGGTSMSSPHNAGSGALMSALYPGWSPAAIKSAIMMTADTTVLKEDGATPGDPFDYGGGRIDLTKAAEVGLVLDETAADFLAAEPAAGGDPKTLNLASLQNSRCVGVCSWSRTVESVAAASVDWTVSTTVPAGVTLTPSPAAFTLAPGGEQTIVFDADVSGLALDTFAFAEISLSETTAAGGSPDLHLPVAVAKATSNLPPSVTFETAARYGGETLTDLQSLAAITDLDVQAAGLVQGSETIVALEQDVTNGDPYDDLDQVFVKTVTVPSGARSLFATTESEEAPDVDLFVGTGATPSADTQVCASTTPFASERCEVSDPAAGTWWIVVQNWQGSGGADDIRLVDAVVPGTSAGNFGANGPTAVPATEPFDLGIFWGEPAMAEGQLWFGVLDFGTDPANPGNIGSIGVAIEVIGIFADGFESGDTSAWSNTVP